MEQKRGWHGIKQDQSLSRKRERENAGRVDVGAHIVAFVALLLHFSGYSVGQRLLHQIDCSNQFVRFGVPKRGHYIRHNFYSTNSNKHNTTPCSLVSQKVCLCVCLSSVCGKDPFWQYYF